MEITIRENLIIENVEEVYRRIADAVGIPEIDSEKCISFIENEETAVFYVDNRLAIKNENENAEYVWLDSGYCKENGDPIFISLIKEQDTYRSVYVGSYIGTVSSLASTIKQRYPRNSATISGNVSRFKTKYDKRIRKRELKHFTVDRTQWNNDNDAMAEKIQEPDTTLGRTLMKAGINFNVPSQEEQAEHTIVATAENPEPETNYNFCLSKELTPITEEIYEQLLVPSWKTINGLDRYLKIIGCRLIQLIEQKEEEYFVLNSIKSAIVNTGLMNQFGADFLVMYRINMKHNTYEAYQIMYGKSDYIENGFTREQTTKHIKPITFFDKDAEAFSPSLEDFDINYRNMLHIIEERRDRFPDNMKEMSENLIATKLQNALERGIRMQHRDKSYTKATYSTKTGTISWLMPFHINTELIDEPELVLVIRKGREFYEIKTILPYDDDMKDHITALSLYSRLW